MTCPLISYANYRIPDLEPFDSTYITIATFLKSRESYSVQNELVLKTQLNFS